MESKGRVQSLWDWTDVMKIVWLVLPSQARSTAYERNAGEYSENPSRTSGIGTECASSERTLVIGTGSESSGGVAGSKP